eukprot:5528096-Amphidinium_carterae.1
MELWGGGGDTISGTNGTGKSEGGFFPNFCAFAHTFRSDSKRFRCLYLLGGDYKFIKFMPTRAQLPKKKIAAALLPATSDANTDFLKEELQRSVQTSTPTVESNTN